MKSIEIHKHDIAVEFIQTAISLFDEGKYLSSLHLAGAAEQIFHDTLMDKKKEPAKKISSRFAKSLGDSLHKSEQPSQSEIEINMDYAKNSIKHVEKGGEYIYFTTLRPSIDAFRMIRRAIKNARLVGLHLGPLNSFMQRNEKDFDY